MMSKALINHREVERAHQAEPTKYIVRCCELRKRRMIKSVAVSVRPRVHVNMER